MSPNQPKTPLHSFRCPDDLWEKGKQAAVDNGETLAEVLRKSIERYVARVARVERKAAKP